MKVKGVIKKISNYIRSVNTVKDYSSDLKNHNIECDIILGSCPNLGINNEDDKIIRTMMDHVILKFTYDITDEILQSEKRQYINAVSDIGARVYDDSCGILYVASNFNTIKPRPRYGIDSMNNTFCKLATLALLKYDDNLYDYEEDETSFEFIELKHRSIRHNVYKGLDIIGYCTCPEVPSKLGLGCMWLSVPYIDTDYFSNIDHVYYPTIDTVNIIKVNLSNIIDLIDFALYHYSEIDSEKKAKYDDEDLFKEKMPVIPSREIIYRLVSIMKNDHDYFRFILSYIDEDDNYDPDEEEHYIYDDIDEENEISQEEFYNAAIDEILKSR